MISRRILCIATLFLAVSAEASAIVLTLEDLPGDVHEGGSVASEYQQFMHLSVSGFGASKVTINITVNGSTDLVIDGGLLYNWTPFGSPGALSGDKMPLSDPAEIIWKGVLEGPQSATVTFQAIDDSGNKSALLTRHFTVRANGVPPPNPNATIDRHPELKSRPLAWTEFDGSYRFDTSSRAEMLDLFWTVFNKPYGDHGWTGSVNPPVAGTTSEKWRVREYAQLNAYRELNGTDPVSEDPAKLDFMQAPALVFAQNTDKLVSHDITTAYVGYNAAAAFAATQALLTGSADDSKFVPTPTYYLDGAADEFIRDAQRENASNVGHRYNLLHNNSTVVALGSTIWGGVGNFVDTWTTPIISDIDAPLDRFIAYPSPGYFPNVMIPTNEELFTWSFVTANDLTFSEAATVGLTADPGVGLKDASVTAKINGVDTPVNNLVLGNAPAPLTWNFGTALNNAPDSTTVEITIHNIGTLDENTFHVTGYRDYSYTVTLFDPTVIQASGPSPKTALVNISSRSLIGSDDQQMIAGFSVSGTMPVRVAVRTQGPGLTKYGITNPAQKTHVKIYDASGSLMGENTSWKQHQDWRLLQGYSDSPSMDNEAGMVLTLWPGNYSAVVSDDANANGVGIVEVFNIDNQTTSSLGNLSTRAVVGANDQTLIAGFVIRDTPRTVVIRTQGPGLVKYGVSNPVMDTVLKVVAQSDGQTVATNDDWQTDPNNARLSTDLSGFAPSDPREAALVLTLPPGNYTALVNGKTNVGVGIVELFDVAR